MVVWNKPLPPSKTGRTLIWQVTPIEMPESLSDLKGSDDAVFDRPVTVYWGPRRSAFDMKKKGDVIRAYTEIVGHGDASLQRRLLNRGLLKKYWNSLSLDKRRVRPAWEQRFPELAEATTARAKKHDGRWGRQLFYPFTAPMGRMHDGGNEQGVIMTGKRELMEKP